MPSNRRHPKLLGLLGITLLALGCHDLGPSTPEGPGAIQVQLDSPSGAEGSAVFEVKGGTGLGVVSTTGGQVFYSHNYGTRTSKVVVVMDAPGQIGFKLRTSQVRDVPTVEVVQAAGPDDELRTSLSGYHVQVTPLEDGDGS